MKIYIASGFDNREYINQELVPLLANKGHEVTSRWLEDDHGLSTTPKYKAEYAHVDMNDIDRSDLIIAYNPSTSTGGGTYFELGYSCVKGKRIVLVGSLSGTVFEDLFSTWKDFDSLLAVLETGKY